MPKRLTLTLLVYLVAILAVSSLVDAKSLDSLNRRDHDNIKRIIKKRQILSGPAEGIGSEPSSVTGSAAGASSTTSVASSSTASSSSSSSAPTSSASSTSSARSSASSSSSSASSTSVSSSSSSSRSSSLASSTSTSTSAAPTTSQSSDANSVPPVVTSVVSGNVVTLTRSVAASATPSSDASVTGAAASESSPKTKGITAVIVVAAVLGGLAILWTIFRKWKLGRSSKFDARLQPINWQDPNGQDHGLPTHRRRASDTSSFHSGIHGGASDMGHGSYGHGSSENGHGTYGASDLPPIPAHDFTAGPAHLAPVGGYADLARGASSQPQMQEALSRGPSMTRNYNANVPLHHQTGYSGAGY